jgi:hypothetical protein
MEAQNFFINLAGDVSHLAIFLSQAGGEFLGHVSLLLPSVA